MYLGASYVEKCGDCVAPVRLHGVHQEISNGGWWVAGGGWWSELGGGGGWVVVGWRWVVLNIPVEARAHIYHGVRVVRVKMREEARL